MLVIVSINELILKENVPTYDPVKKCETAPVFRELKVESAAKKRDFRIAERERLQSLIEVTTEVKRVEREKVIFYNCLWYKLYISSKF